MFADLFLREATVLACEVVTIPQCQDSDFDTDRGASIPKMSRKLLLVFNVV